MDILLGVIIIGLIFNSQIQPFYKNKDEWKWYNWVMYGTGIVMLILLFMGLQEGV